jgi:hypothetical protein
MPLQRYANFAAVYASAINAALRQYVRIRCFQPNLIALKAGLSCVFAMRRIAISASFRPHLAKHRALFARSSLQTGAIGIGQDFKQFHDEKPAMLLKSYADFILRLHDSQLDSFTA